MAKQLKPWTATRQQRTCHMPLPMLLPFIPLLRLLRWRKKWMNGPPMGREYFRTGGKVVEMQSEQVQRERYTAH